MLKKLTNLFWENNESNPKVEEKKSDIKTPSDLANQEKLTKHNFVKNIEYPSVVEENVYDKEMMDGLASVIEENNQAGIDYFEFMQSVNNMKGIPTIDQKFQLVFSALQPSGLTTEKLLSSGKFYIEKLNQTKDEFNAALDNKVKSEVEKNIKDAEKMQEEINLLNQKLIEMSEQQKQLKELADTNLIKINKNKASFEACFNKFVKEISNDLDVISKTLINK